MNFERGENDLPSFSDKAVRSGFCVHDVVTLVGYVGMGGLLAWFRPVNSFHSCATS